MTEAAFIRLSSNPKVVLNALSVAEAAGLMRAISMRGHHHFWPDDYRIDRKDYLQLPMGHSQVPDAYLLALAYKHAGKLASFDRSISAIRMVGASSEILEIVETTV